MNSYVSILICALLFAFVVGRPVEDQVGVDATGLAMSSDTTSTTFATILKQVDINNPDGSYNSSYETSNGIKVENIGYMKKVLVPRSENDEGKIMEEHEELILVQTGSYSYIDPEGNLITLRYIADENGFQPQGDHLPRSLQ